jgi:hypothetical protein
MLRRGQSRADNNYSLDTCRRAITALIRNENDFFSSSHVLIVGKILQSARVTKDKRRSKKISFLNAGVKRAPKIILYLETSNALTKTFLRHQLMPRHAWKL